MCVLYVFLSLRSVTLNDATTVLAFSFRDEMHQFCTEKHYFAFEEELGWFTKEAPVLCLKVTWKVYMIFCQYQKLHKNNKTF